MIFILNRKEIYQGTSLNEFARIRNVLKENGIEHKYRVINRKSSSFMSSQRKDTGTFLEDLSLAHTYYIYVHKNDYELSKEIINY